MYSSLFDATATSRSAVFAGMFSVCMSESTSLFRLMAFITIGFSTMGILKSFFNAIHPAESVAWRRVSCG